ncbi:MAG: RNA polymerase subunit sigma [SAR86 cluster bacterium]|uniref:RNA polymerase subunit sigma n=1 Tax=SAR86 cluster bacterium TaxID=2030880 RepID=A0A2A5CJX5_9GAMM|nr:MAG: RNA polymerase subunit sigma [SAR86 cluster bacterium]
MPPEFEQLIKDHSGRIRAIARRYADESGIDDLYQEILEQLWRSFEGFQGKSKPETWIYRVGFNTAMTRLRKVVKQREGEQKLTSLKQTDAMSGDRCQAEILDDFMASLNDIDTSVLMMYLDGLSGHEMAEVLGTPLNAIQVRISRLKKAFTDRYMEVK